MDFGLKKHNPIANINASISLKIYLKHNCLNNVLGLIAFLIQNMLNPHIYFYFLII